MGAEREPTRLVTLINAALVATVGILTVTGVLDEKVAGSINIALFAWVLVIGEWLRGRVTPVEAAKLTPAQIEKVEVDNG